MVPRIKPRYAAGRRHLSGDFEDVPEAVTMEFTHCGEVGGESFAVSCLKLLDEELYVGGDDFFAGLRLGCGGKGSNAAGFVCGGDAAHGCFLRF